MAHCEILGWGAFQVEGITSVNKQKLDQAKIMKYSGSGEQDKVRQYRAL